MKRHLVVAVAALSLVLAAPAVAGHTRPTVTPGTSSNFELVGHDPRFNRGMNAAPAIFGNYVYIGNRTDGQPKHARPGVLVVDVSSPASPKVVGEIGPPHEALVGQTSRELRVWPQQKLLMVMNFRCSSLLHDCPTGQPDVWNIKFYDLTNPAQPQFVSQYVPSARPHEMFLWVDPNRPSRALLWISTPTSSLNPDRPNLIVTDISRTREGVFTEIFKANPNHAFDAFRARDANGQFTTRNYDVALHSVATDPAGTRAYLSYLGGGFLMLDIRGITAGKANPKLHVTHEIFDRPLWEMITVHSAVKVLGRPWVLTTDEVYGDLLDPVDVPAGESGCPWGWTHVISIANKYRPRVRGQFKLAENTLRYCRSAEGQNRQNTERTSYAAHNPTVLRDLALITWHSGGLQAIDLRKLPATSQAGYYLPQPLPSVVTEDPGLGMGLNKVVMWSYPIIKDGLIYVVDIRNGLYVLRYTGPGADEVAGVEFLEGNSNLGDALRLDAPRVCCARPVRGR